MSAEKPRRVRVDHEIELGWSFVVAILFAAACTQCVGEHLITEWKKPVAQEESK